MHYGRQKRPLQYRGVRLFGEVPLFGIIQWAYQLAESGYCEAPEWMYREWYRIEAIAPGGTTQEALRPMLQAVLTERLRLQYHVVEKERRILALRRRAASVTLVPSSQSEPKSGLRQVGVFKKKSASMREFAGFLSQVAGMTVVDQTSLTGEFQFDVDWSKELISDGWTPRSGSPAVARSGIVRFGLDLITDKEKHQWMVIDRADVNPTDN
jgi:uncharacterized protein (TIGR03435 family)